MAASNARNFSKLVGNTATMAITGKAATVAAGSTLTLVGGDYFTVTGASTISSLGTGTTGQKVTLVFSGVCTLTYNATSLALPTSASIATVAGDTADFVCEDGTNGYWRCTDYVRKSGAPLTLGGLSTTGSAATLTTARTINGVSFNGSANINIEDRLGSAIASAATTTIGTAGLGDYIHITGVVPITSLGTATTAGIRRTLIFDSAGCVLTHNATSLICPGAENITSVAGTVIEVVAETTANWRVVSITHPSISHAELGYLDGATSNIQAQINALSKPTISYLSKSGINSQAMLLNGKLFTAFGSASGYTDDTTGRGLSGVSGLYGVLNNFKNVAIPSSSPIVKVGGFTTAFAYALLADGSLYTWGLNSNGQCGLGHTNAVPTPTLSATGVTDVYDHPSNSEYDPITTTSFIKKSDGYIYGCGYNGTNNLGLGADTANKSSWTQITALGTTVTKLFNLGATYGTKVALTSAGKIYVWGYNGNGCGGNGTTTAITTPTDVTMAWAGVATGVTDLKASGGFAYYDTVVRACGGMLMLITVAGTNYIKASGSYYILGDGTSVSKTSPVTVLNSTNVVDIAMFGGGDGATCQMLKSDNTLYAWGYNAYGAVGNGNTTTLTTPAQVLTGVAKLLCDGMSSRSYGYIIQAFVVKTDGKLYGCGENSGGYLGLGNTTSPVTTFSKVLLPDDEVVTNIGHFVTFANGRVVLALTQKMNVYAWGYGSNCGVSSETTVHCVTPTLINLPKLSS